MSVCFGLLGAAGPAWGQTVGPDAGAAGYLELSFLDAPRTPQARESVTVRVTSDGTVWLPHNDGQTMFIATRLAPQELQTLQTELIERYGLGTTDGAELQAGVARACQLAGLAPQVEGAAVTILRFPSGRGVRELRIDALSMMAARFPDYPELQRIFSAQLRLQNVAAVARAGGEQASAQLAALANESFLRSQPGQPPLTPRDLAMVRELETGRRYIQFYRRPGDGAGELLVSLFDAPGEPPQISILSLPPAGRGGRTM